MKELLEYLKTKKYSDETIQFFKSNNEVFQQLSALEEGIVDGYFKGYAVAKEEYETSNIQRINELEKYVEELENGNQTKLKMLFKENSHIRELNQQIKELREALLAVRKIVRKDTMPDHEHDEVYNLVTNILNKEK